VVVTVRVQRQVAGLFVAEERGSHKLKGVPEPVTLYRIGESWDQASGLKRSVAEGLPTETDVGVGRAMPRDILRFSGVSIRTTVIRSKADTGSLL
jgi:hypothetical protein